MSQARKITDVERTQILLDLVRQRYTGGNGAAPAHVVIEEVAPGTGFGQRWADVLALSCWPSKGYHLDGYEIKASKTDLKRELADPSKHRAVARYCNAWWLVVWDEKILVDGIPDDWGILVGVPGPFETRELKLHRKAAKRTPDPWPKTFVASMVRNAHQQSAGAAFVARAALEANQRGLRHVEDARRNAVNDALRPLVAALYGSNHWRLPADAKDPAKVIAEAIKRLPPTPCTCGTSSGVHASNCAARVPA